MALFIFFRYPSFFSFSIAMAMQNENALAIKKIYNTAQIQLQS